MKFFLLLEGALLRECPFSPHGSSSTPRGSPSLRETSTYFEARII
jgi:hypothetical protein